MNKSSIETGHQPIIEKLDLSDFSQGDKVLYYRAGEEGQEGKGVLCRIEKIDPETGVFQLKKEGKGTTRFAVKIHTLERLGKDGYARIEKQKTELPPPLPIVESQAEPIDQETQLDEEDVALEPAATDLPEVSRELLHKEVDHILELRRTIITLDDDKKTTLMERINAVMIDDEYDAYKKDELDKMLEQLEPEPEPEEEIHRI